VLESFINILDKHSGAISAIATAASAAFTAAYVALTRRMLGEMQRTRRPFVSIDFELPDSMLRLLITNLGQSAARNIKFSVIQDISWIGDGDGSKGLSKIAAIKNGVSNLSPGRSLKFYVGPFHGIPKDKPTEVVLQVSFDDEAGTRHTDSHVFDLKQFADVLFESFQDPNQKVVRALENLQSRSLSSGLLARVTQKQCPSCAEYIPVAAKKCSHCHEKIDGKKTT
jgi:hypothetical protein